jgi:hypothetical protein
MKCTNCLRKRITKLISCQNNQICKIKKNKTILPLTKKNLILWTKENNIEKWYEYIYDADTEDEININTDNLDDIISGIQKL